MQIRFGNTTQPVQLNRTLAIQNFNRVQQLLSSKLDWLESKYKLGTVPQGYMSSLLSETLEALTKATGVGPTTPGWNVMG